MLINQLNSNNLLPFNVLISRVQNKELESKK